jgi:hypothetical protein
VVGFVTLPKPGKEANHLANGFQRHAKGIVYPSQGEYKPTATVFNGGVFPSHWLLWQGENTTINDAGGLSSHWLLWQGENDGVDAPKNTSEGVIHLDKQSKRLSQQVSSST